MGRHEMALGGTFSKLKGSMQGYGGSYAHQRGMEWLKGDMGFGGGRGWTSSGKDYLGNAYDNAGRNVSNAGFFKTAGRGIREGIGSKSFKAGWKKVGWGGLAKGIGPVVTAYAMYKGYKEEGVWGAAKAGAVSGASTYLFGAGIGAAKKSLGLGMGGKKAALKAMRARGMSPAARMAAMRAPLIGAMGIAAIGLGAAVLATAAAHQVLKAGNKRYKNSSRLEMGAPVIDQFGTAATMRGRSIQAIQSSATNGRYAFGNEASLMHS